METNMVIIQIVTSDQAVIALDKTGTAYVLVREGTEFSDKMIYRWEEVEDKY